MKKMILAMLFVAFAAAQAKAADITLNPGDVNNLGVTLSCTIAGGGGGGGYNPPQPPPPPQPQFIGTYRSMPNAGCLAGTPKSDPKTIDQYVSNCGFRNDHAMNCNSTSIANTFEDSHCFNDLYNKENLKGAIHDDQMQDLHNACTVTVFNCYI